MKMTKARSYISAMAVAAVVLAAGATYTITVSSEQPIANAYTSAVNSQDPATARDDYVVTVPDTNLKTALNSIIAKAMNADRKRQGLPEDVVRTADQAITAGDMKYPANMYGPLGLNNKNITNLEGLQFLVNANYLVISNNPITDVSPLQDLPKLTRLDIANTQIGDSEVAKMVAIPKLVRLNIARNPNITNIDPIFTRSNWTELNLGGLKFDAIDKLAPMDKLQYLYIDALSTDKKLDLTPIATLPELTSLNIGHQAVGLKEDDVRIVKDLPKLTALNASGNDIRDLQKLFADGFTKLTGNAASNVVVDQKHGAITLQKGEREFDNPLKRADGSVVPVIETANIKNKGDKIELVGLNNNGSVRISWNTTFSTGALVNTKFTGYLTVNYDLSDAVKPTFSPEQPSKIVSRKGVALNLNDVTAQDNQGGSGIAPGGVTHNAAAINLDPSNPAKGNYELTYSVQDNAGNTATVNRSIEITDADALQQKVDSVGGNFLDGYTFDTKKEVVEARTRAEGIIRENASTQDQINEALRDLERAIRDLRANRRPIEQATSQYNREPEYVQHDPAVSAALQQANDIYNLPTPGPTPAQVKQAADGLTQAMENAKRAEADRQTAAREALDLANQDRTASALADAKSKIAALRDAGVRQSMEAELAPIERAYERAKKTLEDMIARAEDPRTTENASEATKQALADQVRLARALFTADPSQPDFELMTHDLEQRINELRPDITALESAINSVQNESPFVQQDAEVVKKLAAANDIKNNPAATIQQIATARTELEKAIADARATEAENIRQQQAVEALAVAEAQKTPSALKAAQERIDDVQNAGKKKELQDKLAALKSTYDAKRNELEVLIARAEDPKTTENANNATKQALADQVRLAKALLAGDPSQADLQNMKSNVEQKINQLRPDTAALEAVINSVPNESAFVQQDAEVVKKLAAANDIKNNPAATVQQIATAKAELEKAIADARAVEAEQQAERQRQAEAEAAVVAAEAAKTPDTFAAAQAKIDAVKTDAVKQQLQDRLNTVKQAYQAKKDELKVLIDRAKLPETVDGMTKATVDALSDELTNAEATGQLANVPQSAIETAVRDLQAALDALQTDKAPLAAAEGLHNDQPDYIKANPAVAAAFRKAEGTRAMANPPVKQVRDDAKALEDAILAAAQAELNAQQSAATALQQATDKLNAQLAPDEMPAIDVAALEAQVAAVQDPARKMALQTELDALKAKIAARQRQVDDYKQSEEGKRAEAERKAREEAERKAEADRKAKEKAQMDKGGLLSDTGMPVAAPAIGGLSAILAGAWALVRRKQR